MRGLTELYKLDGMAILAPDADVSMEFSDLDAADAGRDESGYLHRAVVRKKVGVWNFSYAHLTGEEYRYMLSVMPSGGYFAFTCPDPVTGGVRTVRAYLSNYGITWHNSRTDHYKNLKFSIIEC